MAYTGVMQSLHKNKNLLFKDFLVRNQHLSDKRIPLYLRCDSRFHEFCSPQHSDGMGKRRVTPIFEDLPSKSAAGKQRAISLTIGSNDFLPVLTAAVKKSSFYGAYSQPMGS
jgi:hypothetical protein